MTGLVHKTRGFNFVKDSLENKDELLALKAIDEIIKHSPPEGVSQSDMDFYEEINQMKAKISSGELIPDALKNKIREIATGEPVNDTDEEESFVNEDSARRRTH